MTTAKAKIAALISGVSTIVVAVTQFIPLTDLQKGWTSVVEVALGAAGTVFGVYQTTNTPKPPA